MKCDLLLHCCKTKFLEKQVKQIMTMSATFTNVLVTLETQYSSCENHLSIRTEIQNLDMLPNNHKDASICELLADLEPSVGRVTPGYYSSEELRFWPVAKVPRDVWDECWATAGRKAKGLTYEVLSVFLLELPLENKSDQHLNPYPPWGWQLWQPWPWLPRTSTLWTRADS